MDDFILPLFLPRFQQVGSYFPHPSLQRADLQWWIASGGEALQLPKDVTAAPFRIGKHPGDDLLPLSSKGVFVGAPPVQHLFALHLILVLCMKHCWRIGDAAIARNVPCCTTFYGSRGGKHFDWRCFCEEDKDRFFVRQCDLDGGNRYMKLPASFQQSS